MNKYYAYLTCFGCIGFMALMMFIAAIDHEKLTDTINHQNETITRLKGDSIKLSLTIKHLTKWHEQKPEQEREWINKDRSKRVIRQNMLKGINSETK